MRWHERGSKYRSSLVPFCLESRAYLGNLFGETSEKVCDRLQLFRDLIFLAIRNQEPKCGRIGVAAPMSIQRDVVSTRSCR